MNLHLLQPSSTKKKPRNMNHKFEKHHPTIPRKLKQKNYPKSKKTSKSKTKIIRNQINQNNNPCILTNRASKWEKLRTTIPLIPCQKKQERQIHTDRRTQRFLVTNNPRFTQTDQPDSTSSFAMLLITNDRPGKHSPKNPHRPKPAALPLPKTNSDHHHLDPNPHSNLNSLQRRLLRLQDPGQEWKKSHPHTSYASSNTLGENFPRKFLLQNRTRDSHMPGFVSDRVESRSGTSASELFPTMATVFFSAARKAISGEFSGELRSEQGSHHREALSFLLPNPWSILSKEIAFDSIFDLPLLKTLFLRFWVWGIQLLNCDSVCGENLWRGWPREGRPRWWDWRRWRGPWRSWWGWEWFGRSREGEGVGSREGEGERAKWMREEGNLVF